jgi:hypothetical protein
LVSGAPTAAELDVVGEVELAPVLVDEPDVAVDDDVPAALVDDDPDVRHGGRLLRGVPRTNIAQPAKRGAVQTLVSTGARRARRRGDRGGDIYDAANRRCGEAASAPPDSPEPEVL